MMPIDFVGHGERDRINADDLEQAASGNGK